MFNMLVALKDYLKLLCYRIAHQKENGIGLIKLASWIALKAVNRCFIFVVWLLRCWLREQRQIIA